ncbi:hypothetical protein GCM10022291_28060 [Postechiella marina]|uniref:Secretion system C-terminal sorting domain-containing protein n=1 Tax=Postechiella marina TaxID=943941 RepID=A0ABP8CEB9_9FLAO
MKKKLFSKLLFIGITLSLINLNLHAQTFTFDTATDTEGWVKNYATSDPVQATESGNGVLSFDGAGKNVTLKRNVTAGSGIDATTNKYLKIIIKNTSTANKMRLGYEQGPGSGAYSWTAFKDITAADTDYNTYYISIGTNANWDGEELNLQLQFRLDNAADAVSGTFYIDELSFFAPVTTYNGILQNPGFDDVPGDFGPYSSDNKTYMTTSASAEETHNSSSQSFNIAFNAPNYANATTNYEVVNFYNAYRPDVGPFAIGDNPVMKTGIYVKYINNEVGAPASKDIRIQGMWVLTDGANPPAYRGVGVTKTLQNGGDWTLFEFERTETTAAFDNSFFRFALFIDDGASSMELGDNLYIDSMTSCMDCPTLGTENLKKDDASIVLYPNPAQNILNISSKNKTVSKVEIYSILGSKVLEIKNQNSINISQLNRGIYISKIYDNNNAVSTKRFIKK